MGWDEGERRKMMRGFQPPNPWTDPGKESQMDPVFLNSPPRPPYPTDPGEFSEDYGMEAGEDENEEGEWEQEEDEAWEDDAEEEVVEDDCTAAEIGEACEKAQEGAKV